MDFDIYNFFIQKGFSDSSAALINLGLLLLIVIFLTLIVSFVSRLIIKGLSVNLQNELNQSLMTF